MYDLARRRPGASAAELGDRLPLRHLPRSKYIASACVPGADPKG